MLSKIKSAGIIGIDSYLLDVEVDLSEGQTFYFNLVGLPDGAVRESRDRVLAGLKNMQYFIGTKKVTVNLAPADIKKEGSGLDLPIAIAIIAAMKKLRPDVLKKTAIVGELGLDGLVKPVSGILCIALGMKKAKIERLIVPEANANEAAIVEGLDIFPVSDIREAWEIVVGENNAQPFKINISEIFNKAREYNVDFSDVKGQESAKRALEVAAAGGHNILMIGPPGTGKTMLAKRLPTILPALSLEESIEITKIHSIAGLIKQSEGLIATRPFRTPHHTTSDIALIGGGATPSPGEVSLAHLGVLFLDEMPEFKRGALEVLRQPLEDGIVTIARASSTLTFPARFTLCGSMNPCPCGYLGHPTKRCSCSAYQIQKYFTRISGPLLDRIDIQIEVPAIHISNLTKANPGESSANIRERVNNARNIQRERYKNLSGIHSNADLTPKLLKEFCHLEQETLSILESAIEKFQLSARAYDRILKVARTIADLENSKSIQPSHISEAINYRSLDRFKFAEEI